MFSGKKDFDFEAPLTHLVWITSAVSIAVTFIASKLLLGDFKMRGVDQPDLWWVLSVIISCGTVAGALIPEIHQGLRQHELAAREGSDQLLQARRRVAEHSVRLRRRQFFRLLDGALHHGADVAASYYFSAKPGVAGADAGTSSVLPRRFLPSAWWPSASWAWGR